MSALKKDRSMLCYKGPERGKMFGVSPREESRDKEKYLEGCTPKLLTLGRIKLLE